MNAIDPKMKVREILEMYPETLSVFRSFNMKCAEDSNYTDKTLEENFIIEQVNFIDVLSQLDKTVYKQKKETNPVKIQNNDSNNQTKQGVCEVCGRTCLPQKVEILLISKHNNEPVFSKVVQNKCKSCIKGGWKYRLMKTVFISIAMVLSIILTSFLLRSTDLGFLGILLAGIFLAMLLMPLALIMGKMQDSPVNYLKVEPFKRLLQEKYVIVYIKPDSWDELKGDIVFSKKWGFLHASGKYWLFRNFFRYSDGIKAPLGWNQLFGNIIVSDIIWKIPLKDAYKNADTVRRYSKNKETINLIINKLIFK